MLSASLKVKLRPIRLAFVVDLADQHAILAAIEASSFLWGGTFNPIIPFYRRLPKFWKLAVGRLATASSVLDGYLDTFDPDFVVTVGSLETAEIKFTGRDVIKCSAILKTIREDGTPRVGISLLELLQQFVHDELRFVRQNPLQIRIPKFGRNHRLFLASAFGSLSEEALKLFKHNFGKLPGLGWYDCSIENYWNFLAPENMFLRRLSGLHIRPIRYSHHRGDCIFLLNADNPIDVIDYWNLRALGWNILPISKEVATDKDLLKFAAEFVEDNAFAFRANPQIYNHTTILQSRTGRVADVENFGRLLKPLLSSPKHEHDWKVTYQFWFPRMWDGMGSGIRRNRFV
jgi:hypothetical protein